MKALIKRIITWWKFRKCRHVFRGPDLKPRNKDGNVTWPCSKCGKVFIEPYGLKMQDYGEITGPWGTRNSDTNDSN